MRADDFPAARPLGRIVGRPAVMAALVLLAYAVGYAAFFAPVIFHDAVLPSDGQLAAFYTSVRLWNPLPLSGMPALAEPHLQQLYPIRWLFMALPQRVGFNLFIVFAYALASALASGYVFALTRSRLAAAVAGLAYGMSGYMIAHLGHTGMVAAVPWIPLTMWSLEELRRRPSHAWFVAGVLSIALTILGGHPQAFVYALYLAGAYVVCLGARATMGWWRYAVVFAAMVAAAAALAAPHLLPMLEIADLSVRAELTFDAFKEYALPLGQLPSLVFPALFGGAWPPYVTTWLGQWNPSEMTGSLGTLIPMLALLGITARGTSDGALRLFWLGTAVVALLLVLGDVTPLLRVSFHLPVINKLRAPARHLNEMTLALAVLAGFGVAAVQRGRVSRRAWGWMLGLASVGMVMAVAVVALRYPHLQAVALAQGTTLPAMSVNAAVWIPFTCFVIAVLVLALWARKPAAAFGSILVVAALVLDLGSFGWFARWRAALDAEALAPPVYLNRYLTELSATHQRALAMLGWTEPLLGFSPVISQHYGLPSAVGYGPLLLQRYAELASTTNGGWTNPAALRFENRALDLLAVRYVVAPAAAGDRFVAAPGPLPEGIGNGPRLGRGCVTETPRSVTVSFPSRPSASQLRLLSLTACSTHIDQGTAVARVTVHTAAGAGQTRILRAGIDTAEWAIDCADVRAAMKHGRPAVAGSWAAVRPDGSHCEGHRYATSIALPTGAGIDAITLDWLPERGQGFLGVTGIELVDAGGAHPYALAALDDPLRDGRRFEHVETIGSSTIQRNLRAMPRAWLVTDVVKASPEAIVEAIHTSRGPDGRPFDPAHTAYVEEAVDLPPGGGTAAGGTASVAALGSDRVEVTTTSDVPALLVLSDVNYPGWRVSVDGVASRVVTTDYALRGVTVPAGTHRVVFRYWPVPFFAGVALASIAAIVLVALGVRARRARRHPRVSETWFR